MAIGIITGSGTHALPGLEAGDTRSQETPYGPAEVTFGALAGAEILHVSRHGPGHVRLSSGVNHRANLHALRELGASAVIGCTACGAVDPTLALGQLVIFDDLHFIANRLPDGSLCTFFTEPGDPLRGHHVLHGGPFSEDLRRQLTDAAAESGHAFQAGGTYGHVDGPRFNTPSEIAQLARAGVAAVSQTGGPETVLAGELELPYALIGFVTDYANEVRPGDPTPVSTLTALMGRSSQLFADVLSKALRRLAAADQADQGDRGDGPRPAGTMLRFEPQPR